MNLYICSLSEVEFPSSFLLAFILKLWAYKLSSLFNKIANSYTYYFRDRNTFSSKNIKSPALSTLLRLPLVMAFNRFRPTSHFIAPHSWSNDPCGAVYISETQEYLICYQWNPGTTEGGNSAWGMARSKDLVTWEDCTPPIQNGIATSYDSLGVFSGSIVSRLIDEKRVLFLFYTSISALPIHWSKEYIEGCESQSVAFSSDFGRSWQRYEHNPLISIPPKQSLTTGWRDPFVSRWESLSALLGVEPSTDYMLIASGERGRGAQLHLYQSDDLLEWKAVSNILNVEDNSRVSSRSEVRFGKNFECASFFTLGQKDYLIVGVEEDVHSKRHNGHYNIWLCGKLVLENHLPKFKITSHGLLDHGVLYAAHIFRDADNRLLQLGWADETASKRVVKRQGWAGCLTHPREIYQISKPAAEVAEAEDMWEVHEQTGMMTTLGIRPAPQLRSLRPEHRLGSLKDFKTIHSTNHEIEATFRHLTGNEKLSFNVRESPNSAEVTKIFFDLPESLITVDRSHSSLENLGASFSESGRFWLQAEEDLHIRIFVDESIVEVFANDQFALSSRIYPSLETSQGVSYDFGSFDEQNVEFQCWERLKTAWPGRRQNDCLFEDIPQLEEFRSLMPKIGDGGLVRQSMVHAWSI
jgi:beta-fructofuranosidase